MEWYPRLLWCLWRLWFLDDNYRELWKLHPSENSRIRILQLQISSVQYTFVLSLGPFCSMQLSNAYTLRRVYSIDFPIIPRDGMIYTVTMMSVTSMIPWYCNAKYVRDVREAWDVRDVWYGQNTYMYDNWDLRHLLDGRWKSRTLWLLLL